MKYAYMIRTIAAFITLLIVSERTYGQSFKADNRERIQLGVKVGVTCSDAYDTKGDEFRTSAKAGFATGVVVVVPVSKIIGFQPEILISQKGFHATGRFLGNNYDFTRNTTYVDVPLMLSYKPNRYLALLAGPQYSYLLKKTDTFHNNTLTIYQEEEFEKEEPRLNTLCFNGGADIYLRHFVFGARAGLDIFNNSEDRLSTSPHYKNYWFQVNLGYQLVNDE